MGLPLVGPIDALCRGMITEPPDPQRRAFGPRYLQGPPPDAVALALGLSMREIMHVGEIVRSMLKDLWTSLQSGDEDFCRKVSERDDQVDQLDAHIKRYLTGLASQALDQASAAEQMRQLRYLNELETIGDVIDKNLCELVLKKIGLRVDFSEDGGAELEKFYNMVLENLLVADTAFTTRNGDLAQKLLKHKERVNEFERELRDRHFTRLNAGLVESHETSAIHLDLLSQLKRINSCVSHVGYAILLDTTQRQAPADRTVE